MGLSTIEPGPLQVMGSALADRLKLGFPPTLFQHAIMPAKLTPQAWEKLVRRPPFVGLGWNRIMPMPDMQRTFRGIASWSVYFVTRNAAGEIGRYFGDAQGPGLFQMVQVGTAIVHGADLGVGTASVHETSNAVAEGWEAGNAVIAALDVEVPIDLGLTDVFDGGGMDVDAFLTDAITWNFEPATDSLSDTIHLGTS